MLSEVIRLYIDAREATKLENHDKETANKQGKLPEPERPEYLAKQKAARIEIQQKHQPNHWLNDAARRASQIQLATHAPKYAHSDAKSSSVNAAGIKGDTDRLGTHSIAELSIDVTGNAAALDVANLLLLHNERQSLWQQLANGNTESLQPYSTSEAQLAEWLTGLTMAIDGTEFNSHTLGKQTYFPTGDGSYHLLTPMFATSLCHDIYGLTQGARYSEAAKSARESRKTNKACDNDVISYTSVAEMTFGGSKPQNISLLNSQRRGTAYLLCSAPPIWQQRIKLPAKGQSAFWQQYRWRVRSQVRGLNKFLDKVENYNNVNIRSARQEMVTGLVEDWLTLVASIRDIGQPGWSADSELPLHEQCLLDPERRDELESSQFNNMLDTGEWRVRISEDFAQWLNKALSNSKRDLGDAEAAVWLKELKDTIAGIRNNVERFL